MSRHRYEVVVHSSADPEDVFALLADNAGWQRWAGPLVRRSVLERPGTPPPDGVGAIRRLGSTRVYSREEIVEFDPPYHLAYELRSGQPVRRYRADVDLEPTAGGGTTIRWRGRIDPLIPGTGPALRWIFRTMVGGFARRLGQAAADR